MRPPEDDNQPATPMTPPVSSFLPVEGERRKEQDRRSAERQGKYDRRKNRCVHCVHFQEDATTGKGLCLFHNTEMVAYAFACPHFDPNSSPEARKPN